MTGILEQLTWEHLIIRRSQHQNCLLVTRQNDDHDIVVNAEEEEEAGVMVDRLDVQNGVRSRQDKSDDIQP